MDLAKIPPLKAHTHIIYLRHNNCSILCITSSNLSVTIQVDRGCARYKVKRLDDFIIDIIGAIPCNFSDVFDDFGKWAA